MVGEHDAPAARYEEIDRQIEPAVEDHQLTVDLDAHRLKDPPGGVAATTPRRRGDGISGHVGQLAGRRQRPGRHDGSGDATGEPPLSVGGE